MLPKQVKELINTEEGRIQLYKKYIPTFELVDQYSDNLEGKDLLTEYELKQIQQKLTGAYMKLYIISETTDTVKTNFELNRFQKKAHSLEQRKIKVNATQLNIQCRAEAKDLREFRNDFSRYSVVCEKAIITCQSLLKKMTNEKNFKGVGE